MLAPARASVAVGPFASTWSACSSRPGAQGALRGASVPRVYRVNRLPARSPTSYSRNRNRTVLADDFLTKLDHAGPRTWNRSDQHASPENAHETPLPPPPPRARTGADMLRSLTGPTTAVSCDHCHCSRTRDSAWRRMRYSESLYLSPSSALCTEWQRPLHARNAYPFHKMHRPRSPSLSTQAVNTSTPRRPRPCPTSWRSPAVP